MNPHAEKCLTCCWAKIHDAKVFCLFAEGTCMKHDQVFKNAVGEKKKPEKTNENK